MSDSDVRPGISTGINHLVLGVRDLEVSHRFYTESIGFEHCGTIPHPLGKDMRFYRASPAHHHHLALMQVHHPDQEPAVQQWNLGVAHATINHYAVTYPTREAFLQQLRYMEAQGVAVAVRGDHGMSHSAYVVDPDGVGVEILYDVPAEVWQDDVNAALNYFVPTATSGPEVFEDNTEYMQFGPKR